MYKQNENPKDLKDVRLRVSASCIVAVTNYRSYSSRRQFGILNIKYRYYLLYFITRDTASDPYTVYNVYTLLTRTHGRAPKCVRRVMRVCCYRRTIR